MTIDLSPSTIDMIDSMVAFCVAIVAICAMWAVGHQEWRRPFDMQARRVILAALAMVAMTHALSPDRIPELVQQIVLTVLLLLIAWGSSPKDGYREPKRRAF